MALADRLLIPLATPFTDDSSAVSEVRLARLIQFYRSQDAAGFVVGTDFAEYTSCSLSERKQILEWAIRESGAMPVYVNATAATTSSVMDLCQHAARHGARAAIVQPPPYGQYTDDELASFEVAVRRHGNLAIHFVGFRPSDAGEPPQTATLQDAPQELEEHVAGRVCLSPTTYEFQAADAVALGVAVFGTEAARHMIANWSRVQHVVQGLFKLAGPARIVKAFLAAQDIEIGPHRGPMMALNEQGRSILSNLLAATV